MKKVNWKILEVIDADGNYLGLLGDVVQDAQANLFRATIENGEIVSWAGFSLSLGGIDSDDMDVDWDGFDSISNVDRPIFINQGEAI